MSRLKAKKPLGFPSSSLILTNNLAINLNSLLTKDSYAKLLASFLFSFSSFNIEYF